jgi:hypothetical protein
MAAHSDNLLHHGCERSGMSNLQVVFFCFLSSFFGGKKATNKPTPINQLVPVTEEEKARKLEGDRNKEERLLAKKHALEVSVPTMEEMKMIHQFFMSDHANSVKGERFF